MYLFFLFFFTIVVVSCPDTVFSFLIEYRYFSIENHLIPVSADTISSDIPTRRDYLYRKPLGFATLSITCCRAYCPVPVHHVASLNFHPLRLFFSDFQVREMAATTLSGFLQCNFLSMDPPMQAHFEALCKTCLPKKRKRELGSIVDTIPSAGGETPSQYK